MKKIVVISALLSLVPGCAGNLQLDASSLFSKKSGGGSAEEPAANTTSQSSASPANTAKQAEVDPAEERRAYYQTKIDKLDELLKQLPDCCQGEDFLLRMTAKYPHGPFVEDWKKALFNKLPRSGESKTPEWEAVLAKYKEIEDALVGAIRLPNDRYKGKDSKEVKAIFREYAAEHTQKPVVDVVLLSEDWGRKSGSHLRDGTAIHFDEGYMRAFVLVEGEAGKGEVWEFHPRKDFIDGGKVKFDIYVPTKIAEMMLSSAKK
jgi:hypothetical protein